MIQTFNFLFETWRNDELKQELFVALETENRSKIIIGKHILIFDPSQKNVLVEYDGENPKFINAKVTFDALKNMINNDFDDFDEGAITYLY